MTTPAHESHENPARWTATTVAMDWGILDRIERAVAKVRERSLRAAAALNEAGVAYNDPANFPVITLESLVVMKLLSNRRNDQVHVEDLIGVGLIDQSWLGRLPAELVSRLKQILDTPDA